MHWCSSVSNSPSLDLAIEDVTREISKKLGNNKPDLGLVFISSHHSSSYEEITEKIKEKINCEFILGCSGSGVIGEGKEFEYLPGVSLTVASLPNVTLKMSGGAVYANAQGLGLVTYVDENSLRIQFSAAESGYAYIKK